MCVCMYAYICIFLCILSAGPYQKLQENRIQEKPTKIQWKKTVQKESD